MTTDSVTEVKEEVLTKAKKGMPGYIVPEGFLDELYKTNLHRAMRELRSEGRIVCRSNPTPGYESWIAP